MMLLSWLQHVVTTQNQCSMSWTHSKRQRKDRDDKPMRDALENLTMLIQQQERVLRPKPTTFTFDMSLGLKEKLRMIDFIWRCNFDGCVGVMLEDNPLLVSVLEDAVDNHYQPDDEELWMKRRTLKLENLISTIYRCQNQQFMPLFTVLRSIFCHGRRMHRGTWDTESALKLLASYRWTDELVQLAIPRNPGAPFKTASFVSGACLDNFTVQVDYKSLHDLDHQGFRLDMTNWGSIAIPQATLSDCSINIPQIILSKHACMCVQQCFTYMLVHTDNGRFGMFKPHFDKYSIIPLFHPQHPDLINNKHDRFVSYMSDVSNIFKRSSTKPLNGRTHITWRKPMFGRLQSSNDDVEHEIEVIRNHPAHCDSVLLLIGGDGLFEMRAEHALARHPNKYLFQCPMVLPIRGEHPHGSCHLLHGGWRLWYPWLKQLLGAADLDASTKPDFLVSDYKQHDHALCILLQAVAEFIDEVCRGGPVPPTMVDQLLQAVGQNLDAAYCVHFLYDFAFMYWQFRQAVRKDGSESATTLDLLWRESTAIFNTAEGHKTQYSPMNVTHIYRQEALLPEIREVVDRMRTLSLCDVADSNVGWDMPTEKLNLYLRMTVTLPYEDLIEKAVLEHNFTGPVANAFEAIMHHNRKEMQPQKRRDITRTKHKIKQHLYDKLIFKGTFGPLQTSMWDAFVMPSTRCVLNPALSNLKTPWVKAHEAMLPPPTSIKEGYQIFIRRHLDNRITW